MCVVWGGGAEREREKGVGERGSRRTKHKAQECSAVG